ncbi:hypothetical protein [Marilutibacter aestuarii]|nr:hypothetical protein [Lysobacter aestuarii]
MSTTMLLTGLVGLLLAGLVATMVRGARMPSSPPRPSPGADDAA